jgi:hypothetical protein
MGGIRWPVRDFTLLIENGDLTRIKQFPALPNSIHNNLWPVRYTRVSRDTPSTEALTTVAATVLF